MTDLAPAPIGQATDSPEIVHLYCGGCLSPVALCGFVLDHSPECGDVAGHPFCVVCDHLAAANPPCPNCGAA